MKNWIISCCAEELKAAWCIIIINSVLNPNPFGPPVIEKLETFQTGDQGEHSRNWGELNKRVSIAFCLPFSLMELKCGMLGPSRCLQISINYLDLDLSPHLVLRITGEKPRKHTKNSWFLLNTSLKQKPTCKWLVLTERFGSKCDPGERNKNHS